MLRNLDVFSFDKARLSGVLEKPKHVRALLITVHGSLVQNRDGDLDATKTWMFPYGAPKRKLFIDISHEANKLGIGVYRYDKRASGASEGIYANTDLNALAKDVISIYKYLRSLYPRIPIGVLGQSEGTMTILHAHKLGLKPDFIVLQGPALEPMEVFIKHQRSRAAAAFLKDPDGQLAKKFPFLSELYRAVYRGDLIKKITKTSKKHYEFQLQNWQATECLDKFRQWRMNGLEALKAVRCPALVVVGELDANVPPRTCELIQMAKSQGMYKNVEVHILPGLEHSFRHCKPGENWVNVMGKPISSLYLNVLRNFLKNI